MQTEEQPRIQIGQVWRNKEKNYTITVVSKLKKDVWKVSAHGQGRTTHKMDTHSFHFYELVSENESVNPTKEEKMNINNSIRTVFNDKLKKGYLFSVDDIVNHLLEDDNMKDLNIGKLKTSVRAFISHGWSKTDIIKKHSNKRQVSGSKKVYQKIKNSTKILKDKNNLDLDISVGVEFFKKLFNTQIEANKPFRTSEFVNLVINTIGGEKLSKEKEIVIKQRIYSFINQYAKKGYIKKLSETSELIKIKEIDNGVVIAKEVTQESTEDKQTIPEKNSVQSSSENNLSKLLNKFSTMPMGELVESFILYFNILQEKEKSHRKTIEYLENKIKDIEKVNIDSLRATLKSREDKIIALNKEVCTLKDQVKQLDADVNHQLDENERLLTVNKELHSKLDETEPTDAWKTLTVGDALSVN